RAIVDQPLQEGVDLGEPLAGEANGFGGVDGDGRVHLAIPDSGRTSIPGERACSYADLPALAGRLAGRSRLRRRRRRFRGLGPPAMLSSRRGGRLSRKPGTHASMAPATSVIRGP